MKKIKRIILLSILFIIDTIIETIAFICAIISNIFERKCKEAVKDIVAIHYYSEEWPDLVCFDLYYNEDCFSQKLKKEKWSIKITKKDFDSILKVIKNNNIINKKKYVLKFPYTSFPEFISMCSSCDGGPTRQKLVLYFRDGKVKEIEGYFKELDNLRKKFEEILPHNLFWGYMNTLDGD